MKFNRSTASIHYFTVYIIHCIDYADEIYFLREITVWTLLFVFPFRDLDQILKTRRLQKTSFILVKYGELSKIIQQQQQRSILALA